MSALETLERVENMRGTGLQSGAELDVMLDSAQHVMRQFDTRIKGIEEELSNIFIPENAAILTVQPLRMECTSHETTDKDGNTIKGHRHTVTKRPPPPRPPRRGVLSDSVDLQDDPTSLHDTRYAAYVVGGLWAAIRIAGGPRQTLQSPMYFPETFDPARLGEMPLPIGKNRPLTQSVSLGSENLTFTRFAGAEADQAYRDQPRTRIHESIDARSGGWTARATRYLKALAGCEVTCTMYESAAGDKNLGTHVDMWQGGLVQVIESKDWWLGRDATATKREEPTVTMKAGDVLFLPQGLPHDVSTPDYSVHLGFEILTDDLLKR